MLDTIKYLGVYEDLGVRHVHTYLYYNKETNGYHKRIKHLGNSEKKLARVVEFDLSVRSR